MNQRNLTLIFIFVLIISFPFWMYIPAILLAIIYFPFFYESIIFGFLIDILYGNGAATGISFVYPFAFLFMVAVLLSLSIRKFLRVQNV